MGIVIRKELRDELDKLRGVTPWGLETRPELIARLVKQRGSKQGPETEKEAVREYERRRKAEWRARSKV